MSRNVSTLSRRLGIKNGLFESQSLFDDLERTKALAEKSLTGTAVIESSRSFYDFMEGENANKRAYVCRGTACECSGKQDEIHDSLEQLVGAEEVGEAICLGHCYNGGAYMLDGQTYDEPDIAGVNKDTLNIIPKGTSVNEPVLLIETTDVQAWYQPLLDAINDNLIDSLLADMLAANLRGRGGAGFPAGVKWQTCRDQDSDEKYILCNADEGDPGAFSDRYLLERHPHSVLFGMMLAGLITGAKEGVLYMRAEYPQAVKICTDAVDELRELGILGCDLNDEGISFDVHIVIGAGAYICGEETAMIRSIEGQRPVVSVRPPFPVEEGLFGKPTVVNNVESFACCHAIIANGGEAFAKLGTERSAGIKLLSLDHTFNKPGLYEVPMGIPLREVIDDLGGGFSMDVKALQIGGPLGGVVPLSKIDDLRVTFESFTDHGFLLGHCSILGIPESTSMLAYIEHLFEFTAYESCGKCFPCRLGATRGKEMMSRAVKGEPLNKELLEDLLETMKLGSLCALGGGVPLPIQNIIQYFPEEVYGAGDGSTGGTQS